jgi:hypothetical protein
MHVISGTHHVHMDKAGEVAALISAFWTSRANLP